MSVYNSVVEILNNNSWSESDEKSILEPFTFITSTPGKNIRSKMFAAFNKWLNVPDQQVKDITRIVDMFHSASLMIDDIEDDSQMRRGMPVAHKVYELFALRNNPDWGTPKRDLDEIVTDELLSMHRGQGLEIFWRDSLRCPTEEQYIKMAAGKTGALLRVGIKLLMACSTTNTDVDYIPLVNIFAVYVQIRDDLMNLESSDYTSKKGFADDLTEGKFSLPVIHGLQADPSNRQIINVLQKRPRTPTLKVHTINYLRNHTKSFDYTFEVLYNLEDQMRAELARLGGNEDLERIMDLLHVEKNNVV